MVTIRVRDTGLGIDPELLPHVFDLFTQADRTPDRSQGGLGIGLTLVRRLVELHGGTVEAQSEGLGQRRGVRRAASRDLGAASGLVRRNRASDSRARRGAGGCTQPSHPRRR